MVVIMIVPGPRCTYQYLGELNLVENDEHTNGFAEFQYNVHKSINAKATILSSVSQAFTRGSPSFPILNGVTGLEPLVAINGYIPMGSTLLQNPMFMMFSGSTTQHIYEAWLNMINTQESQGGVPSALRALAFIPGMPEAGMTPFFMLGRPYSYDINKRGKRRYENTFVNLELSGNSSDLSLLSHLKFLETFSTSLTLSRQSSNVVLYDILADRFLSVLNGTDPNYTYDPFSNALPEYVFKDTGPSYYDSRFTNDPAMVDYLVVPVERDIYNQLVHWNSYIQGSSGVSLPGGVVTFTLGSDLKIEKLISEPRGYSNIQQYPCIDTNDGKNCSENEKVGSLGFLGASLPSSHSRTYYASFSELYLPLTSYMPAKLSTWYVRYHGDNLKGGDFSPRLDLNWHIYKTLMLRGSVGKSHQAPNLHFQQDTPGLLVGVQISPQAPASFIRVHQKSDIVKVNSKGSLHSNIGLVYNSNSAMRPEDHIFFSGDYWHTQEKGPFMAEEAQSIVTKVATNDPDYLDRIPNFYKTFDSNRFKPTNLAIFNGSTKTTSGFDLTLKYQIPLALHTLFLESNATILQSYRYESTRLSDTVDYVGWASRQFDKIEPGFSQAFNPGLIPVPKWKANAKVTLTRGRNLSLQSIMHISSSYRYRTNNSGITDHTIPLRATVDVAAYYQFNKQVSHLPLFKTLKTRLPQSFLSHQTVRTSVG